LSIQGGDGHFDTAVITGNKGRGRQSYHVPAYRREPRNTITRPNLAAGREDNHKVKKSKIVAWTDEELKDEIKLTRQHLKEARDYSKLVFPDREKFRKELAVLNLDALRIRNSVLVEKSFKVKAEYLKAVEDYEKVRLKAQTPAGAKEYRTRLAHLSYKVETLEPEFSKVRLQLKDIRAAYRNIISKKLELEDESAPSLSVTPSKKQEWPGSLRELAYTALEKFKAREYRNLRNACEALASMYTFNRKPIKINSFYTTAKIIKREQESKKR
jgi:hypothetical protein